MPPNEVGFAPKPNEVANISQGTPLDTGVVNDRLNAKLKSIGGDPLSSDISKSRLFEATFNPDELKNIPEFQKAKALEQGVEGARGALDVAEKAATGSSLRVLEEALRTKTDVGAQPLGESDLFKQAGLTGIATLGNSLNERGREIEDRYGSFINQLSKTSGVLRDQYETSLSSYDRLRGEYKEQADRFQGIIKDFQQQERQLQLIQQEDTMIRQREKETFKWNDDLGVLMNSFGEIKELPTETQRELEKNSQLWNSGEIKSANSSDVSGQRIIDKNNVWGGNCARYVQAKKGFEWVPAGMGNVNQRKANVAQNGFTDPSKVRIGDVVLTSEGKTVDENGIPIGHTAIVADIDGDDLIFEEANYKAGMVTSGRRLNRKDQTIIGFLSDPQRKEVGVLERVSGEIKSGNLLSAISTGATGLLDTVSGEKQVPGYNPATEGVNIGIEEQFVTGIGDDDGEKSEARIIAEDIANPLSGARLSDVPIADRASVSRELTKIKSEAIKDRDFKSILTASAGGSELNSTQLSKISKSFLVLDQIGDLQKSIEGVNTGPLIGILTSNNPLDEQARLINAQLTSIIPNLAKGVYGEVGVLTDNDVRLYRETLPNLKSTEEASALILDMTLRTINNSIEKQFEVLAKGGKDVSGFAGDYDELGGKLFRDGSSDSKSSNNVIDFSGNTRDDAIKLLEDNGVSSPSEEDIQYVLSQ